MKLLIYFLTLSQLVSASIDQAETYFRATLFEKAISEYENSLKNRPPDQFSKEQLLHYAQSYYALERYNEAIRLLERQPEEESSLYFLGLAYRQAGQTEKALACFSHFLLADNPKAIQEKGQCQLVLGRLEEAKLTFSPLVDEYPILHLQLARIALIQGKVEEAGRQLSFFKPSPNSEEFYEWNYLKGIQIFQKKEYGEALSFFQLSQQGFARSSESLPYFLGFSYLNLNLRDQAEKAFQRLPYPDNVLAVCNCYLQDYPKIEELLVQAKLNETPEGLLLKAKAASEFTEKERLLKQLLAMDNQKPEILAEGWFLLGLYSLEEGKKHNQMSLIKQAAEYFHQAGLFFSEKNKPFFFESQKLETLAMFYLDLELGEQLGNRLLSNLSSYEEQAPSLLCMMGSFYQWKQDYEKAETIFVFLAKGYPKAAEAAEAWLRAADCADKRGAKGEILQDYRRQVYESYPTSPLAPEAYFSMFTYQEYLQGSRSSLKHLEAFPALFPQSPLLLNVLYLIGLDERKDRKSPEGRWIRKRNLTKAISLFHEIEKNYKEMLEENRIHEEDLSYYEQLKDRATLERALTNIAISEEATGAKKQIFINYAKEALKELNESLEKKNAKELSQLHEESLYWLAMLHKNEGENELAESLFDQLLAKYEKIGIKQGYYLSRAYYEKAMIAIKEQNFSKALQLLDKSEEVSRGKILNAEQTLDLWIQQSHCYKCLNQLDHAMLILSKVINENVISSLRVKAMFLRAEIYELQGRRELARRQLEAVAQKGGDWAVKAKEKLDKDN